MKPLLTALLLPLLPLAAQAAAARGEPLVVMTTLPTERVIAILKEAGEHAEAGESEPRGHKAGQCCGGCSH